MALNRAVTIRFSEEGVMLIETENTLSLVGDRVSVLQTCIVLSSALSFV